MRLLILLLLPYSLMGQMLVDTTQNVDTLLLRAQALVRSAQNTMHVCAKGLESSNPHVYTNMLQYAASDMLRAQELYEAIVLILMWKTIKPTIYERFPNTKAGRYTWLRSGP